ncbi:hypothetical protein Tco_0783768 [Tanacetum coccineum]
MANVSKSISIPNEEFSDDTTPSVARKFLNEADESITKQKALELEIERPLREVVNQDIMSIVQNPSVVDTSNLQTDLKFVTSVNTQFCKKSILGKTPSSGSKLYAVTPFLKSKGLPKIDEMHALINPFRPSTEEKYVPNKVRARVMTNPITVSQPRVITKKDVNSDSNGFIFFRSRQTMLMTRKGTQLEANPINS